ncbi:hypothetical protein V7S43_005141 [Phytophthora oleae]|uniref:Uncharacterized protein n=1 Tax=Phytophthora oleae TaxID=2107226 RepID=A0ABD3FVJ7_9STRA
MSESERDALLVDGLHLNEAGNAAVDELLRGKIATDFPSLNEALEAWQSLQLACGYLKTLGRQTKTVTTRGGVILMASVRRLLLAGSYDVESESLRHLLHSYESNAADILDLGLLSIDPSVLSSDEEDKSRNNSQSLLEDLLLYLVVRKFGATEVSAGGKVIVGIDPHTLVYWQESGAQRPAESENLVESLCGLLLKSEWGTACISTLSRVVMRLQDPRARQRFLLFAFQTLGKLPQSEVDTKLFDEATRLLLLGVTDLWSAIRKDCAKAAAAIVFGLSSSSHIEQFMDSLLCVAIGSRSVSADKSHVTAWTEREGALLALSVLLHSIRRENITEEIPEPKVSQVKDDIKGMLGIRPLTGRYHLGSNGKHTSTQLPRCLVQTLKPAMYQCLRHEQLSVRELAAGCLVAYVSLCEEPTRLLIFQEVISKLNRMNRNEKLSEIDTVANPEESELLDAFEAEGLLDVLARMTPCLPSNFLLKHWKVIYPTLEKYVMHIASSVRQKSSSVVRALASRNLRDEASLELLVQMLTSLSKQLLDESSICWQRKEGRLLSIDVLINVLGESLLACQSDALDTLKRTSKPVKSPQRRSRTLADLQTLMWAHEHAQATWVLHKEQEAVKGLDESLIEAVSAWMEKSKGQNGLPTSASAFWQLILGGCIAQTKAAFDSSQFELHRISRQVVPGLMRLVIWTEQLTFFSSAAFEAGSETSWPWTCMKYTLLHLRYLEESRGTLSENVAQKLATNWKSVWNGITTLESKLSCVDMETVVTKVEVEVTAFLAFGAVVEPPRQVTRFLDNALISIHQHLPKSMQLQAPMVAGSDNSLDRQFCVFLVPVLPVVMATLQYLDGRTDVSELNLSPASRWLSLKRIVLAWLLCDDMFRWITLSKAVAQNQLLESLGLFLRVPTIYLSQTEECEEMDRIFNCLRDVDSLLQSKMKDTTYTSLLDVYLRILLRGIKCSQDTGNVAISIAQLYSERQQHLARKEETSSSFPATESWDEWDEEDQVQPATPVVKLQGSSAIDPLFQDVLTSFDADERSLLREATRGIPDLTGNIPTQHVTQMLQQIEYCVQV